MTDSPMTDSPVGDYLRMPIRFDTDKKFWQDWWTQWMLYGAAYAINNPEPRVVSKDELVVLTRAVLDRLMELWDQPWSEQRYGEARALLSPIRVALEDRTSPFNLEPRLGGIPCSGHEDFAAATWTFHREGTCP